MLESAIARRPTEFPYIPGLLSFRELPAVLDALAQVREPPDLLLCDGQGIAHPRRLGIASHLGLLVDLPSIGVAKTRLCGTFQEPPDQRGAWTPLRAGEEIIGAVLRTRPGVKPLYVSSGHRISLETALGYVMACCTRSVSYTHLDVYKRQDQYPPPRLDRFTAHRLCGATAWSLRLKYQVLGAQHAAPIVPADAIALAVAGTE